jgi:hypothetical protein
VSAYNANRIFNLKLCESLHVDSGCTVVHTRDLKVNVTTMLSIQIYYINLTFQECPVLPSSSNCHYQPIGLFVASLLSFPGGENETCEMSMLCVPSSSNEPTM